MAGPDGSNTHQLSFDHAFHSNPTVCDHGQMLVYGTNASVTMHLAKFDLKSGTVSQMTNGSGELIPSCGGGGDWVFFWGKAEKGNTFVYKMPITGGTPTRFSDRIAISPPFVSPDGKHVLFAATLKDGSVGGALFSADTGELENEITSAPTFDVSVSTTCWMPDNRSIAYPDLRSGVPNLWSQTMIGNGPERQLTHFNAGKVWGCAFSPDGKYVAISHGSRQSDAVLFTNPKS
jgi:TolB protein